MLTNDDLKVLQGVIFALEDLEVSNLIINDLVSVYNKCVDIKREQNKNSNKYNKNNRKYHSLINSLSYHRKRGNYSRVRELEIKLNELKDSTI